MKNKKEALLIAMNENGMGAILDIKGTILGDALADPDGDWMIPLLQTDFKESFAIYEIDNPSVDEEEGLYRIDHGKWRPLTEEEWTLIKDAGAFSVLDSIPELEDSPRQEVMGVIYVYDNDPPDIEIPDDEPIGSWSWTLPRSQDIN